MLWEHHKSSGTSLHKAWLSMRGRCSNENDIHWPDYGGRGITVCDEWQNSYPAFRDWAYKNGYKRGLFLDREDNSGNYSPDNCRWVTPKVSAENRRSTVWLTAFGETKTLSDWARDSRCVVNYSTLMRRARVMTAEKAITLGDRREKYHFNLNRS